MSEFNAVLEEALRTKESNQIVIFLVSETNYYEKIIEITSTVSKYYKKTCYVSLNRPYETFQNQANTKKINPENFFFIDAVTKGKKINGSNVSYVTSPGALTELQIEISKALDKDAVESLLIDSISTLLVYETPINVVRFMHSVITTLRTRKMAGVFLAFKRDVDDTLTKDINMFIDRVMVA